MDGPNVVSATNINMSSNYTTLQAQETVICTPLLARISEATKAAAGTHQTSPWPTAKHPARHGMKLH